MAKSNLLYLTFREWSSDFIDKVSNALVVKKSDFTLVVKYYASHR